MTTQLRRRCSRSSVGLSSPAQLDRLLSPAIDRCLRMAAADVEKTATFDAAAHATAEGAEWRIPVYPNGDYHIFARDGFDEGTFGHPWERTLCVYGPLMVATLGRTLATWLPTVRTDGRQKETH